MNPDRQMIPPSNRINKQGRPTSDELLEIDDALSSTDDGRIWKGAELLGEHAEHNPDAIWSLVVKHGSATSPEVREAIATCVLEHILEHHFEPYFSDIESRVNAGDNSLLQTLALCWKLGQAEVPENSCRWDKLIGE